MPLAKKAAPPAATTWKTEHDSFLAALFRKGAKRGGLDYKKLDRNYIENTVIRNFFPGRNPDSFATLYRRKARQWAINKTLTSKQSKYNTYHYGVSIFSIRFCRSLHVSSSPTALTKTSPQMLSASFWLPAAPRGHSPEVSAGITREAAKPCIVC